MEQFLNEVIAELLGSYKASFYITYFIFVFFGVMISLRIHASSRDKYSDNTPSKFSWKFLVQDKLTRLIGSLAAVFVVIRIGQDLFNVIPTYATAIAMGLGFDQVFGLFEKLQFKARDK
jgi:hypothetical protein